MTKEGPINPNNGSSDFILYTSPGGEVKVEIYVQDESVWLTQQKIAELFGVDRSVVTKHLKNIYAEGELAKKATSAKYAQVQKEGDREVKRNLEFYNLDAIISVGYRVNSTKATQFRIWATNTLKEYIIKGFVLDDERFPFFDFDFCQIMPNTVGAGFTPAQNGNCQPQIGRPQIGQPHTGQPQGFAPTRVN